MPEQQIASKLAEHGLMGLLLLVAGLVIYRLYMALDACQKDRISDAKAHQLQYVELIKTCTEAITNSTSAVKAEKEALDELRSTFEKFVEESRRNTPRRG